MNKKNELDVGFWKVENETNPKTFASRWNDCWLSKHTQTWRSNVFWWLWTSYWLYDEKEVTKRPSPSSTVTPDQPIGRQQSCFAPQGSSSSLWLAGWNIFCPDDIWTLSFYSFHFRLFPLCNWIHVWELDVSMLAWCPSRTEHISFVSSYHVCKAALIFYHGVFFIM